MENDNYISLQVLQQKQKLTIDSYDMAQGIRVAHWVLQQKQKLTIDSYDIAQGIRAANVQEDEPQALWPGSTSCLPSLFI
jgi:hypothetical protein